MFFLMPCYIPQTLFKLLKPAEDSAHDAGKAKQDGAIGWPCPQLWIGFGSLQACPKFTLLDLGVRV